MAGCSVIVHEVDVAQRDRVRDGFARSLDRFVAKGTIPSDARNAALRRITFATTVDELAPCDIVIEAIVEDLEAKRALWRQLEGICSEACIFATNTSSLSVGDQAVALLHPGRMLGLHFFNPVPMMPLVEVVRSVRTSAPAMASAVEFVTRLGKVPIPARDESGFIVNLLLVPYLFDAVRALERGAGSTVDIDTAMKLGTGHPMGPFTLLDFVGLDTIVRIGEIMFDQYREARYAPPPLLRRMVTAGYLGQKNGTGFYDWRGADPQPMELGL